MLAQDIVLTAAHCTLNAENLWVGGNRGWGDLTNPPIVLSRVTATIQHPRYNSSERGSPDLAVLKLEKPLPDRFLPASLGARMPESGTGLIATGYGESVANDASTSRVLRMVLLHVSRRLNNDYLVLGSTREETAQAGHGDSGGPVFNYHGFHVLVGIVSASRPGETFAIPIAPNYIWIKETLEKLGGS